MQVALPPRELRPKALPMPAAGVKHPLVQALLMEVQVKGPQEVSSSPPYVKALGHDKQ